MDVLITTRTPLWTGGVETGRVDRLHETGILGSLRWWMEALVRGMGGEACDPSRNKCQFDSEKYRQSSARDERQRLCDAGLCAVCQLFGATGWRRRFRMEVLNDETQPIWNDATTLNIRPPDRTRGWYLPPGRMGSFGLRFHGDEVTLAQLATLLLFIEQWGGLGAKAQLGYGAFRIQNRAELQFHAGWNAQDAISPTQPDGLPNLQQFGFFRYTIRETPSAWWTTLPGFERVLRQIRPLVESYQTIPLTPVLRNAWRYTYWKPEWGSAPSFWGTLEWERIRSKVLVSWAYRSDGLWHMHGSAWLHGVQSESVWAMLSNNAQWNQTLGVTGQLEVFPHQAWQPWTPHAVRVFLGQ